MLSAVSANFSNFILLTKASFGLVGVPDQKKFLAEKVEYVVVSLDHENRNARLSLRQSEILAELAEDERTQAGLPAAPGSYVFLLKPFYRVSN